MTGTPTLPLETRAGALARVVVGVDGSEAGFEACRQAAALAPPSADVEAVSVVHLSDAILVGLEAQHATDVLREEAEAALARAAGILGERAELRFVNGFATAALVRELERFGASAIAIGSHGHRRATEILLGGVAGELLHDAPCSVLLCRAPEWPEPFPHAIVAGVDGSRPAEEALAAAEELAERLAVPLHALVATGGRDVDLAAVRRRAPFAAEVDAHPVDALVAAAPAGTLLVVGSRGLHGLRALGSVSERVAHRAGGSVLVVRGARAR